MSKIVSDSDIQTLLLNSLVGITDLLKTLTHPKRLQILALVVITPKRFSFLHSKANISKTALANHLNILIKSGLVEKIERGKYSITKDGKDLLKSTARTYNQIESRNAGKMELLRKDIIEFYEREKIKQSIEKLVKVDPKHIESKNTYISAVTSIFQAFGEDYDIIEVSARSGYSFIVNIEKGDIIGTGIVAVHDAAMNEINKAIEGFGWKLYSWKEKGGYSLESRGEETSNENLKRALELFKRVKQVIDDYNTPVILWGVPEVSNYGIVKGYREDSYIVCTHRKDEILIRFDDIKAAGFLSFSYLSDRIPTQPEEIVDKSALMRAIKMAKGVKVARTGYVAGPSAYDEWMSSLEQITPKPIYISGISYSIEAYREAKQISAAFLERLAAKYRNFPHAEPLEKAAREYRNCETLFEEFIDIFPLFVVDIYPFFDLETVKLTPNVRKKGITLLDKIKEHEIAAIAYLEDANRKWSLH
ncbi:MAG: ArsR/SmtB family transcription factor [Candidatus Odinarchaeota archaeon]